MSWSSQPTTTIDFDPVSFAITQTQPANSVVRLDVTTWATLWASGQITRTGLTVAPAGSLDMSASFFSKELERGSYPPRLVIHCVPDKTVIPLDSAPGDVKQLAGLTRLDRHHR